MIQFGAWARAGEPGVGEGRGGAFGSWRCPGGSVCWPGPGLVPNLWPSDAPRGHEEK